MKRIRRRTSGLKAAWGIKKAKGRIARATGISAAKFGQAWKAMKTLAIVRGCLMHGSVIGVSIVLAIE